MSHHTPTIEAEVRDRLGTRYAQRLRKSGKLPGIIYGHKIDPMPIVVDEKEVTNHLYQGAHVMNVTVGGNSETCLVKDIQFGYLGDNVIHIDFARVDLDEEVTVNVSLHFIGEPKALKEPGAMLNHAMTDLEIICKVNNIPDEIVVDQSEMEETIMVGDLVLPEGVRTEIDPAWPVASITFVAEDLAEGEEAEVDEDAAEPEVISEAKPDDDEGGEKEKAEG